MELDWKGLIPIYLFIANEANRYEALKKGKKVHLLIVEGKKDKKFYYPVLNFDINNDDNKKYRFNMPEKNIHVDFADVFISDKITRPDQLWLKKQIKAFEKDYNDNYKNVKRYKFDFVIETINQYKKDFDKLKNIDCYGIIDRDFGHETSEEQLSITSTHDFETNLIRCYMDDYFSFIAPEKRIDAIKVLADVLDFSFRQGILERESFKYVANNPSEDNQTIRDFTGNYFKKNSNSINFIDYDFDTYFEDYAIFYDKLIDNYKKEVELVYTFKDELVDILTRWIIDKNPTSTDNKRLDRIFQYSNGHIVVNQLILKGKDLYQIEDDLTEDIFTHSFVERIIRTKYQKIYRTLPLMRYKEYRIENGYYTLI